MAVNGTYSETGRLLGSNSTLSPLDRSLMAAKDWAEGERQREAEARQDAYEDDYSDLLEQRIRSTWDVQANVEALLKVLDTTNNPLKRIVNEVSVLYTKRPARRLANTSATQLYRQILKGAGDGVVMPRLNRMVNLHNTVLVYVRPAYDSLTLKLVLPQDCTVWPDPDDPTMPLCVEFRECDTAAPNAKPVYWQFDRRPESAGIRKYDANGKKIGPDMALPYADETGRPLIPFVAFHREWREQFWDSTSGDDLYELTIMVGMWETWINHLIRTDSTRQKYVTGVIDTAGGGDEGGTEGIIQIRGVNGSAPNVGEFSSQADWDGLGAQIKRKLENVLNNVGLVLPDTRTSGDPTSGFALVVRSQGLIKIQKAQVPSYEKSEESFYRIVAAVWNFERMNTAFPLIEGEALPPFSEAKPEVAFADVESARTVEEMKAALEIAESEIKMGLASPVTVYMRMNPDVSEDEARAAIEKNLAETKALKPEPPPMAPPVPGGSPDAESTGGEPAAEPDDEAEPPE